MNKYEILKLRDYPIFISPIDQIDLKSKCVINTLNQYSYTKAEEDEGFRLALIESDVLLPDGVGIVAAIKFLKGKKIKKIAGSDMHSYLLKKLSEHGGSCFYLGASEETLIEIKKHLEQDYPCITMGFYSPPFKPSFTEADNLIMISHINSFKPDVLFIGMTAPKQEKWAYDHKAHLDVKIICSVGAVFDYYAGTVKRASKIWINLWMEWFVRLINEPIHMWKRYLYYGPVFIYKILKEKVKTLSGKQ